MAKAKKPNRHTKSDAAFVRKLWRHLQRVPGHDQRAAAAKDTDSTSPVQLLDDGPNGPHFQGWNKFCARLADVYFFWTGKTIG